MPTERIKEIGRTRFPKYYVGDDAFVNQEITFSVFRPRIYTKVWKETEGEAISIRRAKALKEYLHSVPLFIRPHELLVGYHAEEPNAMTVNLEQINLSAVDRYIKNGFIKEEAVDEFKEYKEYWSTRNLRSYMFNLLTEEEIALVEAGHRYIEGNPTDAATFTQPDHELYMDIGLNEILRQLREKLENLYSERDQLDNSPELVDLCHKINDVKAMIIAAEAVIHWANRYSKLAAEMAEAEPDPARKQELQRISEMCAWVPANPARNFWEAMQTHWLTYIVYHCIEVQAASVSLRLDQLFWRYYEKDVVVDKTLSRDLAMEIIQNFLYKADEMGWATAQDYQTALQGTNMVAVYTIGGVNTDGSDACNELTMTILDCIDDMRLSHPDFKFRWHADTDQKTWKRVIEVIRSGLGQPAIKNDDVAMDILQNHYGCTLEEARSWSTIGCAAPSPTIRQGRCRNPVGSIFPAKIVELTLNNGVDPVPLNGKNVAAGLQTGDPTKFETFDELLEAYRKQLEYFMVMQHRVRYLGEVANTALCRRPFASCLFHRSLEASRDVLDVPCKPVAATIVPGMVDAIDALVGLKKLVFIDKKYTMEEVLKALAADWEGYEAMRHDFINTTKFGNDDDLADDLGYKLYDMVTQKGKQITDYDGGHPLPAALVLTWAFTLAPMTGALTNGRKLGDLLADGGGPHAGYDRNGPMSAVLSVAKIDSRNIRMLIFNQKFDAASVAGDTGLQKLKNHIEAAMKQDVEMIQFNIVDRETLLEAQDRPEEYEDLVVRVSGYNVRFVDLTKTLQDGIIARTQHAI